MDPEAAMRLFLAFVTCQHARACVLRVVRCISKCRDVIPDSAWKRACIRIGIALTHFDRKAEGVKGGTVLQGRDLVEFGLEEQPAIFEVKKRQAVEVETKEEEDEKRTGVANDAYGHPVSDFGRERLDANAKFELDLSPMNVDSVRSVADHAILLGRFIEALAFIYSRVGSGLRVNLTPAQVKIENKILRGKAYYDLQSQSWVAIEGFSGSWEEERLVENGPQVEGGDQKFTSKNVVTTLKAGEVENPNKPRFSASKPMNFDQLIFKELVQKKKNEDNELAHAVKGDFSTENIGMIKEHGGCEYLYKSYMVDVSEKRRKESGYMKEIGEARSKSRRTRPRESVTSNSS